MVVVNMDMLIPLPVQCAQGRYIGSPFLRTDYAGAFKRARNQLYPPLRSNEPIKMPRISPG